MKKYDLKEFENIFFKFQLGKGRVRSKGRRPLAMFDGLINLCLISFKKFGFINFSYSDFRLYLL